MDGLTIGIILGLLALVLLAPVVLGLMISPHQYATRVELIKAPPEKVWRALSDLTRQGEWRSEIKGMQMKDDDDGMRWVEDSANHGKVVLRKIKEVQQRELIVQLERNARPCGTRQAVLQGVPGGTRVTFTETANVSNPIERVKSQFNSKLDKRFNQYINEFKDHFVKAA
ncbi:SRPBCC family protein [Thiolinea disciformis]|uniref:SRPBCC family protein n=1 Tax=Thiolinea disciformis TaxID=125614 RepID=UPI0003628C4B|nr:SRPBCC family protein [Thiolinea disciformis]